MKKQITNTKTLSKVLELDKKDLSLREIAKLTGLTGEGVRYLIKKFGEGKKVGVNNIKK
jgi:hypothetical protein